MTYVCIQIYHNDMLNAWRNIHDNDSSRWMSILSLWHIPLSPESLIMFVCSWDCLLCSDGQGLTHTHCVYTHCVWWGGATDKHTSVDLRHMRIILMSATPNVRLLCDYFDVGMSSVLDVSQGMRRYDLSIYFAEHLMDAAFNLPLPPHCRATAQKLVYTSTSSQSRHGNIFWLFGMFFVKHDARRGSCHALIFYVIT